MSSYRKHRKNRTFVIRSIDEIIPSDSHAIPPFHHRGGAIPHFPTTEILVVACTAAEALKGFLAFRATPKVRPSVNEILTGPITHARIRRIVANNWIGRVIYS